MKIVVNKQYGSFRLPEEFAKSQGISPYEDSNKIRTNPELIELVSSDKYQGSLTAIEIPDENTDFHIDDYDGLESIIYVLNGKLFFA